MTGERILVIEDEESYRDSLAFLLGREGFTVYLAETGPRGVEEFARRGADVVLLDLMLPGMSGAEVFKALRERTDVPIIMVTARDDQVDKIIGLELGADDYVTKPYSARELVARIRSVLRRQASGLAQIPDEPSRISVGPITLDAERHTVSKNGETLSLPPKEFALLSLLAQNAGRVLASTPHHRARVGRGLLWRHKDARRAHQTTTCAGRRRPRKSYADPDRARCGLHA